MKQADTDIIALLREIAAGGGGGGAETDPTALKIANNLSDLASAGTARTNLGLVIGTNVQAYNANLTTWAGLAPSANGQSLVTAADYPAMRTLLGLVIGTNVQAFDADLSTWAGITPGAGVGTFLATPSSANLLAAVTNETGTGALVFGTSPSLVTPTMTTPVISTSTALTFAYFDADKNLISAVSGTHYIQVTGTPIAGNVPVASSGTAAAWGAVVAPAGTLTGSTLASGVTASSLTSFGASPALGTPASGVATNLTGTAAGLTAGNVTTNANLTGHITSTGNAAVLGSFTLAQLNTAISDGDVGGGSTDGWVAAGDTWTYASATTFTIAGVDRTNILAVGNKLKLTQTTAKYFYIVAVSFSTNTTVTVTGGSDYSLANAAITSPSYSSADSPVGFPQFFNYVPTWTGYSVAPSGGTYTFHIAGGKCTYFVTVGNGTSNATGMTLSLPVASVATAQGYLRYANNGTTATIQAYYECGISSTATIYVDAGGTAWGNTGTKWVQGTIVYRIK